MTYWRDFSVDYRMQCGVSHHVLCLLPVRSCNGKTSIDIEFPSFRDTFGGHVARRRSIATPASRAAAIGQSTNPLHVQVLTEPPTTGAYIFSPVGRRRGCPTTLGSARDAGHLAKRAQNRASCVRMPAGKGVPLQFGPQKWLTIG